MNKCNFCNQELEDGAKFCPKCGKNTAEINAGNFQPPQTQFNPFPQFIVDNRPFATMAIVLAVMSICLWIFAGLSSIGINTRNLYYYNESMLKLIYVGIVSIISIVQGIFAIRLSRPKDNTKKKLSTLALIMGVVGATFSTILMLSLFITKLPLLIDLKGMITLW